MMTYKYIGILIVFLLLHLKENLDAQPAIGIQKIFSEPVLDGNPFETAWENIEERSLYMLNPNAGFPPSERTEFKIAYSDKFLFVAGFLYDAQPDKIQSTSKRRDDMQLNNDFFGISLDSYYDKENGLNFSTTPAGIRLDMQILNDGDGDSPFNRDWNVIWDVETTVTDQGWFAELRIPLSSLRYQDIDGKVIMGMVVFRYL